MRRIRAGVASSGTAATTPRRLRTVASIPARGTVMDCDVGAGEVTKPYFLTAIQGS